MDRLRCTSCASSANSGVHPAKSRIQRYASTGELIDQLLEHLHRARRGINQILRCTMSGSGLEEDAQPPRSGDLV